MRLYDNPISGNAYKVRLLLAHLRLPYERIEISVLDRSDRAELLGDKNPALRIPVLELDDGRVLAESNAILWYLADATPYLPDDRFERAKVLQWLFFEQYDHEPGVAVARFLHSYSGQPERHAETIRERQKQGQRAIARMENYLHERLFLVGNRYTIADIALFAYTHVADEAGIGLRDFPAVRAWLGRVASERGHIAIAD